jgi:hypothetical protein
MRKGRFDIAEQNFIRANKEKISVEEMATQLDRDPASVALWIKNNVGATNSDKKEIEAANELKDKAYWYELEGQFSEDELEMFKFHWKKMWSQFREDVFHTEEIQIVDTIKLEILMNRSLKSQHDNQKQLKQIESDAFEEKLKRPEDRDVDYLINLERQAAMLRASQEALSRDYKDLQTKKSAMIKDLKGTREQRIKAIEDSKTTFAALVKKIAMDYEYRSELGLEMEKMRLAMEKERERLAQAHTYEDGSTDQPFLTAETVE